MTIKLEPGKYYRTRDGRKAYCLGKGHFEIRKDDFIVEISDWGAGNFYANGSYYRDFEDAIDIIAEW